ncbi:MAG: YncE family protein, partial [Chloroflexota bacterium]
MGSNTGRRRVSVLVLLLMLVAGLPLGTMPAATSTVAAQGVSAWEDTFTAHSVPGAPRPASPALVAADGAHNQVVAATAEGTIFAFDARTRVQTAARNLPHGLQSLAIDETSARLYAAGVQWQDQTVQLSILSLPDLRLVKTVKLADSAWVRQIAFDPTRHFLYALITHSYSSALASELWQLDTIGQPLRSPVSIGGNPSDMTLDVATGRLFVLIPDGTANAAILQTYGPDGSRLAGTYLPVQARLLLLDPARRRVYAAGSFNGPGGDCAVLNADTLAPFGAAHIGRWPTGLALDQATGRVWVAAHTEDSTPTLSVIDPTAGLSVAMVDYERPVGNLTTQVMAVDTGTRGLWLANNDHSLSILDLDSRDEVESIVISDELSDVAVDPLTGRALLLSSNADMLYVISPEGAIIGRLATGREPTSLRFDASGGRAYVLNRRDGSISVIDVRSLRPLTELPLPFTPTDAGWDLDPSLAKIYLLYAQETVEVAALVADSGQEVGRAGVPGVGYRDAALTVNPQSHLVYVAGYATAILDGNTLASVGSLPGQPRSFFVAVDANQGYGVNECEAKSCGTRTYVYDLSDQSPRAQLEGVGKVTAVNEQLGHMYAVGHPAQVVDMYTFDRLYMPWRADDLAADARRGRVYFLDNQAATLRAVDDHYPQSDPATRSRPSAKVEIVWPHDQKPVTEANLANIGVDIFQPASYRPVAGDFGGQVVLWRALNNEPAVPIAVGKKRMASGPASGSLACPGFIYPTWDFNDVDVSAARDPNNRLFFYLTVDGQAINTNVWSHAADARTYFPQQDVPDGTAPVGEAVDTRIQIVWPHDGAGHSLPVSDADVANIGVLVFNHGTQASVPTDWNQDVLLYRSLNNGAQQLVGKGRKEVVTQD